MTLVKNPKTCTIEGCSENLTARGWCRKHYYRWKRWGHPTADGKEVTCQLCEEKWLWSARGGVAHALCESCRQTHARCSICRQILPLSAYYLEGKGASSRCRPCSAKYSRGRNSRPPTFEQSRRSRLKTRYGITVDEWQELLDRQQGRCAICAEEVKLNIDHCHKLGTVRGLLCHHCNTGLGHFKDSTDLLRRAAEYLERVK